MCHQAVTYIDEVLYIVNRTLKDEIQWNSNKNANVFIKICVRK